MHAAGTFSINVVKNTLSRSGGGLDFENSIFSMNSVKYLRLFFPRDFFQSERMVGIFFFILVEVKEAGW